MKLCSRASFSVFLVPTLVVTLLLSQTAYAQAPIVSRSELMQAIVNAAKNRKENLGQIQGFFASDLGHKTLALTRVAPDRVQKVIPTLSNDEVAKLAAQTRTVQNDFAAGALNNEQITYILIALAAAVVVLVLK